MRETHLRLDLNPARREQPRRHQGIEEVVRGRIRRRLRQRHCADGQRAFSDRVLVITRRHQGGDIWIAATLRADFYARMLEQPALKKFKELGATYDLAAPGPVELAEIVRAPAEAAGFVFETDAATGERLDQRLLIRWRRDTAATDGLPRAWRLLR
jgi:hypothetical protein